MVVWGITPGNAGMQAQVRALAGALGETPVMKNVDIRKSFAWIPNVVAAPFRRFIVPYFIDAKSDAPTLPYPDIIISCGRRGALVAMGLRHAMPMTKFIHIQDPQVSSRYFDLVIAMEHDKITGPNVIKTRYALHSITPDVLRVAAEKFAPRFAGYAKPLVAVLLGGSTNKYQFGKEAMAQVIMQLQQLLQRMEGTLLITPSRRTGEENVAMLRGAFAENPRVYVYTPPPLGGRLGGGLIGESLSSLRPPPNLPPSGGGTPSEIVSFFSRTFVRLNGWWSHRLSLCSNGPLIISFRK